ncbi:MAG: hypothetical protein NWR47_02550 [Aestuariivirgaceae bacterium]|nr:hypothetical protein [Aestuariivirgaceae bacterium]
MNLAALALLSGWFYVHGLPDWTTHAGALLVGATVLAVLNSGYLVRRPSRPSNPFMSPSYANALKAMEQARQSPSNQMREYTIEALLQIAGSMGTLSADQLMEAAGQLQRRGEYERMLESLASLPVAHEILRLAGQGHAFQVDDARVRLEGLLALIHAPELEDGHFEFVETDGVRLDALYPENAFDIPASEYAEPVHEPETPSVTPHYHINYEDVVSTTMQILPIDKISGLSLAQRRMLFSLVRRSMENANGKPSTADIREIKVWLVANSG